VKSLRFWFVAMLAWMFALYNVERLHEPINLASFVYVFAALVSIAIVGVSRMRSSASLWFVPLLVCLFLAMKAWLGYRIVGTHLPITVTELCALLVTVAVARRIAANLHAFEEAASDVLLVHLAGRALPLSTAQQEMYREMKRCRTYDRPLALLWVAPTDQSLALARNRLIAEVQREATRKYVDACLAELLLEQTQECDIVAQSQGHFVVLMPEADRTVATDLLAAVVRKAQETLGLNVRAGISTFPGEEVTLVGLLERAEAAMQTGNGHDRRRNGHGKPIQRDLARVPR